MAGDVVIFRSAALLPALLPHQLRRLPLRGQSSRSASGGRAGGLRFQRGSPSRTPCSRCKNPPGLRKAAEPGPGDPPTAPSPAASPEKVTGPSVVGRMPQRWPRPKPRSLWASPYTAGDSAGVVKGLGMGRGSCGSRGAQCSHPVLTREEGEHVGAESESGDRRSSGLSPGGGGCASPSSSKAPQVHVKATQPAATPPSPLPRCPPTPTPG